MFFKRAFSSRWFILVPILLLTSFGLISLSNQPSAAQVPEVYNLTANRATLIIQVNYAQDWVAGITDPGESVTISLEDNLGTLKDEAQVVSADGTGDFFVGCEDWIAGGCPDIVPGDKVFVLTNSLSGEINPIGAILIDSLIPSYNTISGTLDVDAFAGTELDITCEIWEEFGPMLATKAQADGGAFTCDFTGIWDIQPGDTVAVTYYEPDGDRVIDVFEVPAPYLRVEKQGYSELTQNGNAHYQIKLWNDGSAPADNILLTDTMDGLVYLEDTSGLPRTGEGSGPITWDVGTLEAGHSIQFDLFAQVTASDVVTNTISVTTTTFDLGEPWEKAATWVNAVIPNDTYLRVGKTALTNNPAPDQNIVFALEVCNDGETASSAVTLSDNLAPALSLVNWWSDEAGWTESSSDSSHLVVTRPTIDSGACSSVFLRAHLSATAYFGDPLTNTAQIDADNDLSPDDNQSVWEGQVDHPQVNVRIDKEWLRGQLVPGGEIHYLLRYENTGNVPLGALVLRDTFPINTSFLNSWILDPWGRTEFLPETLTNSTAAWQIPPGLENGASVEIELALVIDPDSEPGALLVNSATIDPLPGETNQNDNSSTWSEVIYPALPNLRIHKWHEWLNDGQILYRIQFENIGSEPVDNVWVTDMLPVDTEWDGWQIIEFDLERLVFWDYDEAGFHWNFEQLLPGESGLILFRVNLTEPGTPLRWYTNSVEITLPVDDPNPADNYAETAAFSGGEVRSVAFWLNPAGASTMWGEAIPNSMVTVITPLGTFEAFADPECGGCWQIEDVGVLSPGDIVTVSADQEVLPVEVTIPDPFTADINCATDEVSGQVGGWYERPVEVHGEWPDGFQEVVSDPGGNYSATFLDIPCSGSGYVRVVDMVSYCEVRYHLPFEIPELILEVNYSHDGVEGLYEPGHTVSLEVKDQGENLKATAQLETQEIPWWEPGQTGFSTHLGSPWDPLPPDIVPGDWVIAEVDNGQTAEVQIGEINGTLNISNDTIEGDVYLYWLTDTLQARCSVWEEGGPTIDFEVNPDHGHYTCDLAAQGWDLLLGHHVAVQYQDPNGHWVINVFNEGWQTYLPLVLRGD